MAGTTMQNVLTVSQLFIMFLSIFYVLTITCLLCLMFFTIIYLIFIYYFYLFILGQSTYKFERPNFRHARRNDPKVGTHVQIDTLTLNK